MPLHPELAKLNRKPKVLLLGSGGLSIGQAGEFDYSGTQAVKGIRELGADVVVINPNIATVQTDPRHGARIYLYPVEPHWVEKVIEAERPDGIVAGFGGQTALNCLLKLDEQGILKKYNVLNLGTSVNTLRVSEDRELFAARMREIGMPVPPSMAVNTVADAVKAAQKIGYPVIVRAAYALGGLGSGFASDEEQLRTLVQNALVNSPQVLVEKSLRGWKEVEYEVMRDGAGNIITICNMENFDPLGIHTGDSIVVCPSQSLSDDDYQLLRNASIEIIRSLEVVGECNVQFALSPTSLEFYVIEVNARLSRSSALASKASGYPIAYIASKVVMGYELLELKNPVTGITYAYFEPALDYITVKIPRWDLVKFRGASRKLGSTMKSVGEVMSIGRGFPEALQKAVRMVSEVGPGLSAFNPSTKGALTADEAARDLREQLREPTDTRLFAVLNAFRGGMDIEEVHRLTSIDKWFLAHLRHMVAVEREIAEFARPVRGPSDLESHFSSVDEKTWRRWKQLGFGDQQIAYLALAFGRSELGPGGKSVPTALSSKELIRASRMIRKARLSKGVRPVVKRIDTTAGEYPSETNYFYLSYLGMSDDVEKGDASRKGAVVLGGGAYRIGTSVEFDWCAVSCSDQLRRSGWRSIMINCNPETVSTDYNSSDRLYFEELTLERILDICEFESPTGVVASMGGQLPNRLARPIAESGLKLLGHSAETIDAAEDRSQFSGILDRIGVDQPRWTAATSKTEVDQFIGQVGFPVLVRPSYVLSGSAMKVVFDPLSLEASLQEAGELSSDYPVVISEFMQGAREVELDGVAQDGEIVTAIVSEHVENAGIHSGDATMAVPSQKLYVETVRKVRSAGRAIAQELKLSGPFNIQFLARSNHVKVIECNVRAARSFPFVSKVMGVNLADLSARVMMGEKVQAVSLREDELGHVGVKAPMFSFTRLVGADPVLGVEMASTGEVGCIGPDFDEALLLAFEASHIRVPRKGVLVSSGPENDKIKFLDAAAVLKEMGIPIFATEGTAGFLKAHGFEAVSVAWSGANSGEGPDVSQVIRSGKIDLVINIPKNLQRKELSRGGAIRQTAIQCGISLLTNMESAVAFLTALSRHPQFVKTHRVRPLATRP